MYTGASFTAYAQTAETDQPIPPVETIAEVEEEDDFGDREVVVTGSRLHRTEFTSASPLQVIDGETARDLGLIDAADFLGQTTVVQGQQISTGVSTSAGVNTANGPGSATASLRGLTPRSYLGFGQWTSFGASWCAGRTERAGFEPNSRYIDSACRCVA